MAFQYIDKGIIKDIAVDYFSVITDDNMREMYLKNVIEWSDFLTNDPVIECEINTPANIEIIYTARIFYWKTAEDGIIPVYRDFSPTGGSIKYKTDLPVGANRIGAYITVPQSACNIGSDENDNKAMITNLQNIGKLVLKYSNSIGEINTITCKVENGNSRYFEYTEQGGETGTSTRILASATTQSPAWINNGTSNYPIKNIEKFKIKCNIPVFYNEDDLDTYLLTGNTDRIIGGGSEKPTSPIKKLKYLHSNIFRSTEPFKKTFSKYEKNDILLYYDGNGTGLQYKRFCAGFIQNETTPYNIKIVTNPKSTFINGYQILSGVRTNHDKFNEFDNPKWCWSDPFSKDMYYWKGQNDTNIPIFRTYQECLDYFDGLIDENSSLNGGGNGGDVPDIGDDPDVTELNNVNAFCPTCDCVDIPIENIRDINTQVFKASGDALDNVLNGLKLYGANPLGCIVDAFALPFKINPFFELVVNDNTISMGALEITTVYNNNHIHSTKVLTMFESYLDYTFNDFRDYLQRIYVYLPFTSGLIELDLYKYLAKTIKCEVYVDARTGSIKYYMRANGVICDTIEGCVRMNTPISGNNGYDNSFNKLMGAGSIIGGGTGVIMGGATLNAGSIAGGISSIVGGVREMNKKPETSVNGSFNSQTMFKDQLNAYLVIVQPNIEYGNEITNRYGYPDNRVGVIGSNSGYLEIDDVKLVSSATESEKNEIISMLRGGIYV